MTGHDVERKSESGDKLFESMESLARAQSQAGKYAFYQNLCERLIALLGEETNFIANAANTAALLFHSLADVNWVGFYLAHGEELVVGPFQGKPACVRIPFGRGVCGAAAESGNTIVVPDVNQFPGHIACDPASRSEIVVPLMTWGKLVGVLDIDSAVLDRFDEDDREGLESIASVLLSSQSSYEFPDLGEEAADL